MATVSAVPAFRVVDDASRLLHFIVRWACQNNNATRVEKIGPFHHIECGPSRSESRYAMRTKQAMRDLPDLRRVGVEELRAEAFASRTARFVQPAWDMRWKANAAEKRSGVHQHVLPPFDSIGC
eukprot:CAMPEP_0181206788 /NCGR_PEP_ID=MMETSP1096-20121128/21226_1 /TAXON_ID=156174 ORGANISM="Chrysochromulina ericina, Strain CCMP281" /NCGR_SAMPLE_ID=MMETSP1096 /ASSEMBLY_ACC=CAM_ASM_000453 /LENGTH=123 /DNA_ID=CAMNT_0023297719 /DNA_START=498 /DNA_END=869 /DNA_ORIENTATION=-